jgi:methionyl-tRNA formyltransferase
VRLAFAGTPQVALPSLRALLASPEHEVVAVVTRAPAPAGRGRRTTLSAVHELAAASGVEVLTPTRAGDAGFLDRLRALGVQCCPVVAYGALLPPAALAVPEHGWVNLHFSLLPAWRGAAPVPHAILHGDDVTGASTFRLEAGLDTGPVYGVVTEPIRATDTAGDLLARLADSGANLLVATLDGIAAGSVAAVAQPSDGVSLAPKLSVEDARVDWTAPGRHVDRLIRACTPAPGAWTTLRAARIKLGPVRVRGANELAPGQIAAGRDTVAVGTMTTEVELGIVQPAGKRAMPALDWARGLRLEPGERLG